MPQYEGQEELTATTILAFSIIRYLVTGSLSKTIGHIRRKKNKSVTKLILTPQTVHLK